MGEYAVDIFQMPFYQYSINPATGKYEKPRKMIFEGKHVVCSKPISLMLNLNSLSHEPFDEQTLFDELLGHKDEGTLMEFCKQHPLFKTHWKLIGTHDDIQVRDMQGQILPRIETNEPKTEEANGQQKEEIVHNDIVHNYYERFWKNKGLGKHKFVNHCLCGYGLKQPHLVYNYYIFNPHNNRLVVIGSHCQKRFDIKPQCLKCEKDIKFNEALLYNHNCKECFQSECSVCGGKVEKVNINRVCVTCKELGNKRFKTGKYQGKSYLTLFKSGENMLNWKNVNPSTHLGKFIARIGVISE